MKKGLVPALRFPEYRDANEWNTKQLNKIANIIMGSSPKSSAYNENGVGLPLLQGNADIKSRLSAPRIFTSQITKECEIGDILLSVRAPVGTVAKSIHNACIGRGMSAIQAIHDNYQEFIYQWLLYFEPFWSDISQGGTFDAVNSDDIRKLLVPITEKEEQKKIADCLSSLDDLIAAHTQKHQALQSYKKGLLQNLFPAEGEMVPALRFPEFENADNWVKEPLENVARYENGKAHEQGITKSGDFVVVNSKFISTDGEVKKYTDKAFCLAKKGDILMVLSDVPNGRAIAKCFFVDENNRYTVNQRICKLSPKKAVGIMLFYSLNRNPYFLAFDDGVKQTNLRKDDVLNCRLLLPKDIEEQQKIADCLCSVDDLIRSQAQKIEDLKSHKKGLMQQLFPSVDEVGA